MCAACASPSAGACTVGSAEQPQQLARFVDHLPRQPRGHRRFRVGGRQIAARQRLGVLALELAASPRGASRAPPPCGGGGLPSNTNTSRRPCSAISRVVRKNRPDRCDVMRPCASLQRRAVAQPNQREELIELAVAVDGERPLPEMIQGDGLVLDDRREDDAHGVIVQGGKGGEAGRAGRAGRRAGEREERVGQVGREGQVGPGLRAARTLCTLRTLCTRHLAHHANPVCLVHPVQFGETVNTWNGPQ